MPRVIPIQDLQDTAAISRMCNESLEPIYITKNGCDDMVIISLKAYEQKMLMQDVYGKLASAEAELNAGKTHDALASLNGLRAKYGL